MLAILDSLAAYLVYSGHACRDLSKRRESFVEAKNLYDYGDKVMVNLVRDSNQGYDPIHLAGKAVFCLLTDSNASTPAANIRNMEQAEQQFNFLIAHAQQLMTPSNDSPMNRSTVIASLGNACIAFNRKKYAQALQGYKSVMKISHCPAEIRLGLGHCYYKLGKIAKAKEAFERTLVLDPKSVEALVALAVIELSGDNLTNASIRKGVQMLSKAYSLDSLHPMVLNHLANHFFFKKDYNKVHHLALHAFHNTSHEGMKAESCYQLARQFHVQEDYDQAFQYYYQASQFASTNFVLPQYGLGQLYIKRNDIDNACASFEKVLKVFPGNYETMKILGHLYASQAGNLLRSILNSSSNPTENRAQSTDNKEYDMKYSQAQSKLKTAKEYLLKVTSQMKEDFEAWIELAQILEQADNKDSLNQALQAYQTAIKIIKDKVKIEVPPEIHNNVSVIQYRLKNYKDAKEELTTAIKRCCSEQEDSNVNQSSSGISYYDSILVTMKYNEARLLEQLHETESAFKQYKDILRQHPNYIDCFLRLGVMARNTGQIYDASDWFKQVIGVHGIHPDAWTLIGNLHLSKHEWGPAQKKFERIVKENPNDTYSLLSLANVWLSMLDKQGTDKQSFEKYSQRALSIYKQVLRIDNRNMYATNGIGCVVAYKACNLQHNAKNPTEENAVHSLIQSSRDLFAQVREATADLIDVWLNIAHIYIEQKQYTAGIQMYDNCLKKFFSHDNVQVLLYSARAHFLNNDKKMCKKILLKARRVAPSDPVVLFNLALVMQKEATSVFSKSSDLTTVMTAVYQLNNAQKYFKLLENNQQSNHAFHSSELRFPSHLIQYQVKKCQDLLSQAEYHVKRAKALDDKQKEIKKKQDEERMKIQEDMKLKEQREIEEREKRIQEMQEKRKIFVEESKAKMTIDFKDIVDQPKKVSRKRRVDDSEFVNDYDSYSDDEGQENRREKTKKSGSGNESNEAGPSKERSVHRTKQRRHHHHKKSRDEDRDKRRKRRKDKSDRKKSSSHHEERSSGKSSRFVSKEFIDDDSSSDDDNDNKKNKLVINEDNASNSDASDSSKKRRQTKDSSSDSDVETKKTKYKKRFDLKKFQRQDDDSSRSSSSDSEVQRSDNDDDNNDEQSQPNSKRELQSDSEDEESLNQPKKRRVIESDDEDEVGNDKPSNVQAKQEDSDDEVMRSPVNSDDEEANESNRSKDGSPARSPSSPEHSKQQDDDDSD